MLREADRWAAASSDPRGLTNGGQYLARLLGVWEDFQEGRYGLVSLWGTELKAHINLNELTVPERLELVRFRFYAFARSKR